MGAQEKILLFWLSFHFLLSLSFSKFSKVILIVSFVSSGMDSNRKWITPGFNKLGILVFFAHRFVEFNQRAQQNLFFSCLTED